MNLNIFKKKKGKLLFEFIRLDTEHIIQQSMYFISSLVMIHNKERKIEQEKKSINN